jgi:putative tricarboxylic transport membrane protein
MDTLINVAHGFGVALLPINLLYCFIGVFIGTLVGVLPGIGPISAMSLLLLDVWRLDHVDPRQYPG